MSSTDNTPERRLAELRAHDRTGFYASNKPGIGADDSGRVTVTVDPTNRVTRVEISGFDDALRTAAGLAAALEQACAAARTARVRDGRPDSDRAEGGGSRPRQVARAGTSKRSMIENYRVTGRAPVIPDFESVRSLKLSPITATVGTSQNQCVTVTLDPGSSHGAVAAEPDWLANASSANITSAVNQAFIDAYRKQDLP